MAEKDSPGFARNPLRALLKIIAIVAVLLGLAMLLGMTLSHDVVRQLKFNMSLSSLITVVVIINLVSFACFIVLHAAYQWVRRDLKSPRSEDDHLGKDK